MPFHKCTVSKVHLKTPEGGTEWHTGCLCVQLVLICWLMM